MGSLIIVKEGNGEFSFKQEVPIKIFSLVPGEGYEIHYLGNKQYIVEDSDTLDTVATIHVDIKGGV